MAELTAEPDRMAARARVIAHGEVPHPGAQLRHDGRRITCFATNTSGRQLPDLKRRHRRRARAGDRIRWVNIGLANLPLHDAASNAVWLAIVLLACDLLTRTQTLPLSGPLRVAEPKTLRLRLVSIVRVPNRIRAANPATAGPALALGRHGGRRRSGVIPDPG